MASQGTFLDLCIAGTLRSNEIDDFIDEWHEAPRGRELADHLGMTRDEYSLWLRVPDALAYIVKARREMTPLADAVVRSCEELRRGAPVGDESRIARLEEWLSAKGELI